MTPQERQLVVELFDRLVTLENSPRDRDAEGLIAQGIQRAPHAVYALVQTALVQDEALRRANARIEELQAEMEGPPPGQAQGGFLDNMRDAVFGKSEPRGSVPSVPRYPSQGGYPPPPPQPDGPPRDSYPGAANSPGPAYGGGGFLGTAASTAAGVIGGSLLLNGIRSMFGQHLGTGGQTAGALANPAPETSPWRESDARPDLARDAGIDHIGRGNDAAGNAPAENDADFQDSPDDEWDVADDSDFDDDVA